MKCFTLANRLPLSSPSFLTGACRFCRVLVDPCFIFVPVQLKFHSVQLFLLTALILLELHFHFHIEPVLLNEHPLLMCAVQMIQFLMNKKYLLQTATVQGEDHRILSSIQLVSMNILIRCFMRLCH